MEDGESNSRSRDALLELTADVVGSYVSNNSVPIGELPSLISDIYIALGKTCNFEEPVAADRQKPAVNPKKSVQNEYLVCLEDGNKFKSLKRHLMTYHGLTPQQYREKWSLDSAYPMVAPAYAISRSQLAKSMGLGRKGKGAGSGRPRKTRSAEKK